MLRGNSQNTKTIEKVTSHHVIDKRKAFPEDGRLGTRQEKGI